MFEMFIQSITVVMDTAHEVLSAHTDRSKLSSVSRWLQTLQCFISGVLFFKILVGYIQYLLHKVLETKLFYQELLENTREEIISSILILKILNQLNMDQHKFNFLKCLD